MAPRGSKTGALVALMMAALVVAAACSVAGAERRLFQATAVANSVASSTGGSSSVTSTAGAQSTGTPTTAVATGQGSAGPGQTVVVNCDAYAKDSTQYKNCVNTGSGGVSWESAPACNASAPNATCLAKDTLGRCWGYEQGKSCAYKDASGKPLNETSIGQRSGASPSPGPSPSIRVSGGASPSPSPPAPPGKSGHCCRRRHEK